jgi:mersacidin/lichenicidin family type 2 lantibiotic
MQHVDLVRVWKDDDYRRSLDPDLLQNLPAHPAGDINEWDIVSDSELDPIISTHSRILTFECF